MVTQPDAPDGDAAPRLRRAFPERAARAFLPACLGEWLVAEGMYLYGVPWADVGLATAAAAAIAYSRIGRTAKGKDAWNHARHAAFGISAAGAWLTAADGLGPYGGPHAALAGIWAAAALGGGWWLNRHDLVSAARDWRRKREDWHQVARRWGLPGSFLLHHEYTRTGEMMIADVTGTGLASVIARTNLPERIAQDRRVPRNRVEVKEAPGPAGRIVISIRETDPWKHPFTHPVFADAPEIDLRASYSVAQLAVVGQVPESGDPISLPLCDEYGGKVVSVVGIMGAGKTTMLNCLCERITAAPDAILVKLNLSMKGYAERDLWGPACLLTALGNDKDAAKRAIRVMRIVNRTLAERSKRPKLTADFVPSPEDPLIVVMTDEADAAVAHPALAKELDTFATKCREFGGTLVVAGQRGTADFTSPVIRSQTSVVCLGAVNRSGEAMHAAGDAGLSMPNMAEYGEGRPGVWVIGGTAVARQVAGRTFNLSAPDDIRRLVTERAYSRPVLPDWIAAALGDEYERLLGSDVFAEWARRSPGPAPAAPPPAATAREEGARAPVAVLDRADPLTRLDQEAEDYMNEPDDEDDLRTRWAAIRTRNNETARIVNELTAEPLPDIPPDQLAKARAERWRQFGEETEITPEQREKLTTLLTAGTTITEVAGTLGVTKWAARGLLEKLRGEGLAAMPGKGRGARWRLAVPDDGDGT